METQPTAATVGKNLKRLRKGRAWSTRELTARLAAIGHSMSNPSIVRTESGTRDISASDLMALASIFNVSPLAILLPLSEEEGQPITFNGLAAFAEDAVTAGEVWSWATGGGPLKGAGNPSEKWRYLTEGLPVFRRLEGGKSMPNETD